MSEYETPKKLCFPVDEASDAPRRESPYLADDWADYDRARQAYDAATAAGSRRLHDAAAFQQLGDMAMANRMAEEAEECWGHAEDFAVIGQYVLDRMRERSWDMTELFLAVLRHYPNAEHWQFNAALACYRQEAGHYPEAWCDRLGELTSDVISWGKIEDW